MQCVYIMEKASKCGNTKKKMLINNDGEVESSSEGKLSHAKVLPLANRSSKVDHNFIKSTDEEPTANFASIAFRTADISTHNQPDSLPLKAILCLLLVQSFYLILATSP